MKAAEALQAMFDGKVLFEQSRPSIYITFDREDNRFISRFDNSDGKCAEIWMAAMPPWFNPDQEWIEVFGEMFHSDGENLLVDTDQTGHDE